jgi:V-type H+-transporting ATPase subunit a
MLVSQKHRIHQIMQKMIDSTDSWLLIELSSVLWDMTLKIWFRFTGPLATVGLVIGFSMWFTLTCAILIGMEGLSAFLHALRLHWVEFDGKFYMGDGVPFEPFSFNTILELKSD